MGSHRTSALRGHREGNEPAKDRVARKLSGKAIGLFQKSTPEAFQGEWPTVSVDRRGKHTEMDVPINVLSVVVLLNTIRSAKENKKAS